MDGSSDDQHFRYKMPALVLKHEGKGKMKKTLLVNIKDVCESIGRPADYLMTYLGQKLSATAKVEKEIGLSYVTGHHDAAQVQEVVLNFVRDAVMCRTCHKPETTCHTEGSKKRKELFLKCKCCRARSELDSGDRFVKYMISHPAQDVTFGHASSNTNATTDVVVEGERYKKCEEVAGSTRNEQRRDRTRSKKGECPTCHHKTSKSICSKCGSDIGLASLNSDAENCSMSCQIAETHEMTKDLVGSLRLWMATFGANDKITVDDLLAHVKMEGFTNLTSSDHLGAVVEVLVGNVCCLSAIGTTKMQPVNVAQESRQIIDPWTGMVNQLVSALEDGDIAVDVVVCKVQETVACTLPADALAAHGDCVVVGLLLALRVADGVAKGLLRTCRRLEVRTAAMNKFVDFLESQEMDDGGSEKEAEELDDDESKVDAHGEQLAETALDVGT